MYVELYASCSSSSMSDTVCISYLIFHGECEALCIMHHLNVHHAPSQCLTSFMHVMLYSMWPLCFMRHAPSPCVTPYSSLIFNEDIKWNASFYAHAPSEYVTPYRIQVSYSVLNAKLCKSCTIWMSRTIWMSHTVCHVSFHVEFEASCLMHHLNV